MTFFPSHAVGSGDFVFRLAPSCGDTKLRRAAIHVSNALQDARLQHFFSKHIQYISSLQKAVSLFPFADDRHHNVTVTHIHVGSGLIYRICTNYYEPFIFITRTQRGVTLSPYCLYAPLQ